MSISYPASIDHARPELSPSLCQHREGHNAWRIWVTLRAVLLQLCSGRENKTVQIESAPKYSTNIGLLYLPAILISILRYLFDWRRGCAASSKQFTASRLFTAARINPDDVCDTTLCVTRIIHVIMVNHHLKALACFKFTITLFQGTLTTRSDHPQIETNRESWKVIFKKPDMELRMVIS